MFNALSGSHPVKDRIFISYRRADAGAVAGRLRDRLEELFPGHVFLDVDDIAPGQDFVAAIEGNLASAAALLVVIGNQWLRGSASGAKLGDPDDYVTRELAAALRMRVPIVPVLVDGADMPDEQALPQDLRPFTRNNAARVRHESFRRDCEPLVEFLYDALQYVPPTPLERFIESLAAGMPFGARHLRFDERMRGHHAVFAFAGGMVAVVVTAVLVATGSGPDLDMLFALIVGAYTGFIGKNSRDRRKLACAGLILLFISLAAQFVLFALFAEGPSAWFGSPVMPTPYIGPAPR